MEGETYIITAFMSIRFRAKHCMSYFYCVRTCDLGMCAWVMLQIIVFIPEIVSLDIRTHMWILVNSENNQYWRKN